MPTQHLRRSSRNSLKSHLIHIPHLTSPIYKTLFHSTQSWEHKLRSKPVTNWFKIITYCLLLLFEIHFALYASIQNLTSWIVFRCKVDLFCLGHEYFLCYLFFFHHLAVFLFSMVFAFSSLSAFRGISTLSVWLESQVVACRICIDCSHSLLKLIIYCLNFTPEFTANIQLMIDPCTRPCTRPCLCGWEFAQ